MNVNNHIMLSLVTDKQVSPKSGTLKSPPKGFDTSAISKTYYNLVSIRILFSQYNTFIVYSLFPTLHQEFWVCIAKLLL